MSVGGVVLPSSVDGLGTPGWPGSAAPQTAGVLVEPSGLTTAAEVGAKPPWNQPQVMPLAFTRSPTFRPSSSKVPLVTVPPLSTPQSSSAGSLSPVTVTAVKLATLPPLNAKARCALPVCPETRLRTPGVDGPKVVLKELSLMAKCWA